MADSKTQPTAVSVADFIAAVDPPDRRAEAEQLDALFRRVTGFDPVMWGGSIIGYGSYHYRYDSGREGDAAATGFSPRKADLSIYIMPGYQDYGAILARLGKHRLGNSCLYLRRLSDVDMDVLADLIRTGLDDLGRLYPVSPAR